MVKPHRRLCGCSRKPSLADRHLITVGGNAAKGLLVGFLTFVSIKLAFKLFIWTVLIELWLCWALIAFPIALISDLTGHARTARQWQRSMNWRHAFRL